MHAQVGQARHHGQEGAGMAEQAAHAPSPWPEQISQQLWDSAPAPQQAPPTQEVMLPSPRSHPVQCS